MADYGSASYWDERYASIETNFDWYQDFCTLEKFITPLLKPSIDDFEILIPGCGSSKLGPDLYDLGFVNVTNIDTSAVVISQMADAYTDREEMEFTVMDARNMEFIPDQCFDLIIDKALMDALICSENNLADVHTCICEMARVLKTDGKFVVVSHAAPSSRINLIKRSGDFDVEYLPLPKPEVKGLNEDNDSKYHYMYICSKVSH